MFDATTPKRDLVEVISRMYKNTVPKEEIFSTIQNRYPEFNHDILARSVASFISEESKHRNKIPVYLSVLIFVVTLFRSVQMYIFTVIERINIVVNVMTLLLYMVYIITIIGLLRYKLFYFTTAVSLYTLILIISLSFWLVYPLSVLMILHTFEVLLTLMFLVILRKNLFPNINFWGNVKKDVNKNYIF